MTIGRNCARAAAGMLAALGLLAGGPAAAQVFKAVNFEKGPQPAKIAAEGTEVTVSPIPDGEGMIRTAASIKIPGYPVLVVTEDTAANSAFDRWVGIGKLAATDPVASVLLQGFTGGAHCCATMTLVTPWKGALKTLTFESIDGSGTERFPADIDKDGVVDIYRQDDRFRYQFASGAGSYSPPILYNVRGGELVDVSSEPRFAPFWEDYAKEMRGLCADQESVERNSACAAYVVAGQHLGRFDAALREANTLANNGPDAQKPEACKVDLVDYACPEGQQLKFANFEEGLRWVMKYGKSNN
ncbi:MAG: hypothetical protein EOP59_06690 [Sphingomonadales bacterium]|nr:MAG: hypothetical protein EOP59_06690 [Sphingomonadales bacterium]